MEQKTLNVKGMSCGHCISSIEGNVGKLNGIKSVKVNLSEGNVELTFDHTVVSLKEITDVIEEQGYDVEEEPTKGQSCH